MSKNAGTCEFEKNMGFLIVDFSVLISFKMPIQELGGFADHYYLCETPCLDNSVAWGSSGIELQVVCCIVFYRLLDDGIEILQVVSVRRNLQDIFREFN